MSECPARYFVTLCTTMSAPNSNGCWKTGVANVLSTTTSALRACASLLTAAMSVISKRGLVGDSIQTSRVFGVIAASTAARSPVSICLITTPIG